MGFISKFNNRSLIYRCYSLNIIFPTGIRRFLTTLPRIYYTYAVIDHDPSNAIICSIGYTCRLIPSASYIAKLYHVSPVPHSNR